MEPVVNDEEGFEQVGSRKARRKAKHDAEMTMVDDQRRIHLAEKIDRVIERFDANVAVTSNINVQRRLNNDGIIQQIATELCPMKLSITTLGEVFTAFMEHVAPSDLDQKGSDYWTKNVYFAYDKHRWCGTITFEYSPYSGVHGKVKFTNIRLPNDGYLYTRQYVKNTHTSEVVECDEVSDVLANYIAALGLETFADEIVPTYRHSDGRFQVKIWNTGKSRCYSINYEYGTYESNLSQPSYNLEAIRDRLSVRKASK